MSTDYIFKKNSFTGKHQSPPRHFIPKSKSSELTVKPKVDMIECQTYHIHQYDNHVTITVQTTPFLPQVGLFLSNNEKTFIIIDVNQELKAVEFDYYYLLSLLIAKSSQKESDPIYTKRQFFQEPLLKEDKLILSCVDVIKLFNRPDVHTFVVDMQGYKNITKNYDNNHFVINNKFKI